jgi:hypothetical protein
MKYNRSLQLVFVFIICLSYSSCKKEEDKPVTETPVAAPVITSSTVFADNTIGYIGGTISNESILFFGVQGDSAGYSIHAMSSATSTEPWCMIKTYSPNWPATLPSVGTYNLVYICDTCSHPLLAGEAIMYFKMNGIEGQALSGTVHVAFTNNKYVYTFSNIPAENFLPTWAGKLVSP